VSACACRRRIVIENTGFDKLNLTAFQTETLPDLKAKRNFNKRHFVFFKINLIDFGRVPEDELDRIDFSLSVEPGFNKRILNGSPVKPLSFRRGLH
jgi:hypothetical protein